MASKKQPEIVPVSVRTGKPIKRPRKGQKVKYAVRGPRGGLKILRDEPQEFYKTDLKGLNKIIKHADKNNFIAYEQKLRFPERDKKGKIKYRTDAKGKKHKIYKTKITFAKPRGKTKPLLFKSGKKLRALDLAFKKGNYKNRLMERGLTLVKPNIQIVEQVLTGRTIKEALSNIQVDINMKEIRKKGFGLFYNIHVQIKTPSGEIKNVPVSGKFLDREFQGAKRIPLKGQTEIFGRSEVKIMANLHSAMAKSIRYSLKNSGGYAFTALATLERFEKTKKEEIKELDKDYRKIKGQTQKDRDAREKIIVQELVRKEAIKNLYFGNKKRFFINNKTRLTPLKPNNKVIMFVKFEVME